MSRLEPGDVAAGIGMFLNVIFALWMLLLVLDDPLEPGCSTRIMDYEEAESLKVALEAHIHALNVPMHLAAKADDADLRRLIGGLSADVVSKIDFEIMPHLFKHFPNLKDQS